MSDLSALSRFLALLPNHQGNPLQDQDLFGLGQAERDGTVETFLAEHPSQAAALAALLLEDETLSKKLGGAEAHRRLLELFNRPWGSSSTTVWSTAPATLGGVQVQVPFPFNLVKDPNPEAVREEVQRIGHQLFDAGEKYSPPVVTRLQDNLTNTLSNHPDLLSAVMRFTDVLPEITGSDAEVIRLFREYFPNTDNRLPGYMNAAIRVAHQKWLWEKPIAGGIRLAIKRMAHRYISGSDFKDALPHFKKLASQGMGNIVDLVGEAVTSEGEADLYLNNYRGVVEGIVANVDSVRPAVKTQSGVGRGVFGVQVLSSPAVAGGSTIKPAIPPRMDAQIAIKLSSLYSQWNPADPAGTAEAVKKRLRVLLDDIKAAQKKGVHIGLTIDLEQNEFRELTYDIFKQVFSEPAYCQMDNVGIVVQAYLKNALGTLKDLADWSRDRAQSGAGKSISIRLVKGAYWDYENIQQAKLGFPQPTFNEKSDSDINYERCVDFLVENADALRPAFASHNIRSLAYAIARAKAAGVPFHIEMLDGMADDTKQALLAMGVKVWVYEPVGKLFQAMAYLARRMLENSGQSSFLQQKSSGRVDRAKLLTDPSVGRPWPPVFKDDSPPPIPTDLNEPFRNEPLTDFSVAAHRDAVRAALINEHKSSEPLFPPFIIGGEQQKFSKKLISVNPSDPTQILAAFGKAEPHHAALAVQVAQNHLEAFSQTDVRKRANFLLDAAQVMREKKAELTALLMLEAGKPLVDADAEVAEAIDFLEYYARQAVLMEENNRDLQFKPRGVAAVIAPWNFPLAIFAGMTVAALATGNTVVAKPAEQTPLIGYKFIEILHQAAKRWKIPEGVVTFLPGDGETGKALVEQPEVKLVAFTGSLDVGLNKIYAGCAPRGVRVIAEMGGKNAMIVSQTAHPDDVIKAVLQSKFGYAGQKCSALDRLIIVGDEAHYANMRNRLMNAMASLRVGNVEDFGVSLGPVIDHESSRRLLDVVTVHSQRRVKILQDPNKRWPLANDPALIKPILLEVTDIHDPVWNEEFFGPVLAITRAASISDASTIAKDCDFALTGGALTRSPAEEAQIMREWSDVGMLYLQRNQTGAVVGRNPFGGNKLSGIGSSKAGGEDYLWQFVDVTFPSHRQSSPPASKIFDEMAAWTQKRMEGLVYQPSLLGESNRVDFRGRESGCIITHGNIEDYLGYLTMALYSGHDTVHLKPTMDYGIRTDELKALLEQKGFKVEVKHIDSIKRDHITTLEITHETLGLSTTVLAHPAGEMTELGFVDWIASRNRRELITPKPIQESISHARRARSITTFISADPRANKRDVFNNMTTAHTVTNNIARYGFVAKPAAPARLSPPPTRPLLSGRAALDQAHRSAQASALAMAHPYSAAPQANRTGPFTATRWSRLWNGGGQRPKI